SLDLGRAPLVPRLSLGLYDGARRRPGLAAVARAGAAGGAARLAGAGQPRPVRPARPGRAGPACDPVRDSAGRQSADRLARPPVLRAALPARLRARPLPRPLA